MLATCVTTTRVDIADIVAKTPVDHYPMFQVISGYDEFLLGEMVALIDGHYHVCMTFERVGKKQISELRFISYIDKKQVH